MTPDEFWRHIDHARQRGLDTEGFVRVVEAILETLPDEELQEFDRHQYACMDELHFAGKLWEIVAAIDYHPDGDWGERYRAWVVSCGRAFFEAALNDPESVRQRFLAAHDDHD